MDLKKFAVVLQGRSGPRRARRIVDLYVSSISFAEGRGMKVKKIRYTNKKERAVEFAKFTAEDIAKELFRSFVALPSQSGGIVMETIYKPGDRVLVFDSRLFKNDVTTPLSHTMRPATVERWYGEDKGYIGNVFLGKYPGLLDVRFDHRPEQISQGHFSEGVKKI